MLDERHMGGDILNDQKREDHSRVIKIENYDSYVVEETLI